MIPPDRQLPAPWDAVPAQQLLALVDPGNPAELLHAIDLIGGRVTSDVLCGPLRPLKSIGLRLQFAGVLTLAGFVMRPRRERAFETCLVWALTDHGRAFLAELRAERAPRFDLSSICQG